jgi:hypothetical protein
VAISRCLESLDRNLLVEANGDRHVASLLAMTRFRFMATPKYAGIQQARDDEVFEVNDQT